jgi:hypothetical protein
MNKIYLVLLPEKFQAKEYEEDLKEIFLKETELYEEEFHEYKNNIIRMINNFSKSPGIIYDNDNEYDLPFSVSDIIIPFCKEAEFFISSYETDGDQIIINLREYSDKIEELL